ncbi:hypothetical protein [Oceanobacillus timonensis]|uniref:hypothetical protein n=1 Tax=Oceanobacillus timonensis TaxID=1926285 RepID=UPI0009BC4D9D|nr:hypothetical protein [Oceanobacillus timonensis]
MSFHNPPYSPGWGWQPYRQHQENHTQQSAYQGSVSVNRNSVQDSTGKEKQLQGTKYETNTVPGYSPLASATVNQRPENGSYDAFSAYPVNASYGASPDMQHMVQMMYHLKSQLEQLNQLITQNNQLLESLHQQEDTKCVQGSGGGAVIVRM